MIEYMSDRPKFFHPRFWPTWCAIGFFHAVARMPWMAQRGLARLLGWLLYYLAADRRHIVAVNLRLCFPQWTEKQRQLKAREVFFNNALGLIETANGYYLPRARLRQMVEVSGLELLQEAVGRGRGVILIGAHFSHLDLGGVFLSLFHQVYCMYRPHNNPLMDEYIKSNRLTFCKGLLENKNMRAVAKTLKQQEVVWYPPDQDYGKRHSVFAPFFGVNAATVTATSKLARLTGAEILTISYRRDGDRQHYFLDIETFDPAFPSGDEQADAVMINKALEAMILKAPTQYMWTHRRFKSQPGKKGEIYR